MKVFVSGATGVLGRRVSRRLLAAGHTVVGLSRSDSNREQLESAGVEPRRGDLFDEGSLRSLSEDCGAFLHLATAIPTTARTSVADWSANDRIRRDGTQAMLAAARGAQAELFLCQSLLGIYLDRAGTWLDETVPAPRQPGGVLQSAVDMEMMVEEANEQDDLPTAILRFGMFYSADSAQTVAMLAGLSRRRFPLIGDGQVFWNLIHVDDAAAAIVAAVERRQQVVGRVIHISDEEPVQMATLLEFLAAKLGAGPPLSLPLFLARLMLGGHVLDYLLASFRNRNQLAKELLGWQPRYPSYREGYPATIERWRADDG